MADYFSDSSTQELSRQSALDGYVVPGQYGKVGRPGVFIQELPELVLWQLAAWNETRAEVLAEIVQAIGLSNSNVQPGALPRVLLGPGSSVVSEKATILSVEPLKWWMLGSSPSELGLELTSNLGIELDLSHSRSCLRLSGEQVTTVLNRHLALDLRAHHCAVGMVMSTGFEHVGVTLWRRQAGFDLFLPRGFAVALFELLCKSSEQFGYELG